jgi:exodeoxyribonuclease VII small subunit
MHNLKGLHNLEGFFNFYYSSAVYGYVQRNPILLYIDQFNGKIMAEKKTFEEALTRLEEIVQQLEEGKINLDEMLKIYEEGAKLVKFCLTKLDDAENKIKVLTGDSKKDFSLDKLEQD